MSEPFFVAANLHPTEEQRLIQTTRARHLLVEANAGAAKTTTLALRMAQALERGADPAMLLALTYTAPAVQALRRQLRFIGLPAAVVDAIRIHSFESFSAALLRSLEAPGCLQLSSDEQLAPYVLAAIEQAQTLAGERHPEALQIGGDPAALIEGLLQTFTVLKGRMLIELLPAEQALDPQACEELGFDYLSLRVRSAYERLRRGEHPDRPLFRGEGDACYDLARAVLAEDFGLQDSPFALGLALIVVDEMHDTHRAMFTVLKALLAANPRAAFVGVGDRDQVIHGQAGAEAAFMHAYFDQEIARPLRLPLTASHRFGPTLALAAGKLARKPYAAQASLQTEIRCLAAESPRVAAQLIARLAQEHLAQTQLQDLRILLRQPAQSIAIERELLRHGVAYAVEGLQPFLQRPEILLVRGLQAFCSANFSDFADAALRARTLEALMLFAGAWVDSGELSHLDAAEAQRLAIAEAVDHPQGMASFIEGHVLRTASPSALARLKAAMAVLRTRDLAVFVAEFLPALDPLGLASGVLVRQQDIQQVRDNLVQLVRLVEQEGEGLDEAFRVLHRLQQGQAWLRANQRANHRVTLSSIESAKGLEFDHVLIPGLSRGEFVGTGGAHENRNLLYVAMTRARQRLSLSFNPARPSRFLLDAGLIA